MCMYRSQHDAHEFFSDLTALLHEDMSSVLTTRLHASPYSISFEPQTRPEETELQIERAKTFDSTPTSGKSRNLSSVVTTVTSAKSKCHSLSAHADGSSSDVSVRCAAITPAGVSSAHGAAVDGIDSKEGSCTENSRGSELDLPLGSQLLPTSRRLQSNVEVTLRCTTCGHERVKTVSASYALPNK
jgi:hypothetical protein